MTDSFDVLSGEIAPLPSGFFQAMQAADARVAELVGLRERVAVLEAENAALRAQLGRVS